VQWAWTGAFNAVPRICPSDPNWECPKSVNSWMPNATATGGKIFPYMECGVWQVTRPPHASNNIPCVPAFFRCSHTCGVRGRGRKPSTLTPLAHSIRYCVGAFSRQCVVLDALRHTMFSPPFIHFWWVHSIAHSTLRVRQQTNHAVTLSHDVSPAPWLFFWLSARHLAVANAARCALTRVMGRYVTAEAGANRPLCRLPDVLGKSHCRVRPAAV
jgi:hypothetical protein